MFRAANQKLLFAASVGVFLQQLHFTKSVHRGDATAGQTNEWSWNKRHPLDHGLSETQDAQRCSSHSSKKSKMFFTGLLWNCEEMKTAKCPCWWCFLNAQAALGSEREKSFFCYIWITFILKYSSLRKVRGYSSAAALRVQRIHQNSYQEAGGCKASPLGRQWQVMFYARPTGLEQGVGCTTELMQQLNRFPAWESGKGALLSKHL